MFNFIWGQNHVTVVLLVSFTLSVYSWLLRYYNLSRALV